MSLSSVSVTGNALRLRKAVGERRGTEDRGEREECATIRGALGQATINGVRGGGD